MDNSILIVVFYESTRTWKPRELFYSDSVNQVSFPVTGNRLIINDEMMWCDGSIGSECHYGNFW